MNYHARDGLFFDKSPIRGKWKKRQKELSQDLDPQFAPQFVIDNKDKFGYLLENPYKSKPSSTTTSSTTTSTTVATTTSSSELGISTTANNITGSFDYMKILKNSFLAGALYQHFMAQN